MRNVSLVVLAVFLFAVVSSFADTEITSADIPFSFIAEGKTYPAGTYRFFENTEQSAITITGEKPVKTSGVVLITTRLAARSTNSNDVDIVFDVVGKDHYLSEIHMPDVDGFYFKSAQTKHTHTIIKGKKRS